MAFCLKCIGPLIKSADLRAHDANRYDRDLKLRVSSRTGQLSDTGLKCRYDRNARHSRQSILVPLVQSGGLGSARTLLNPKPPDPEAAFAFPAFFFPAEIPEKPPKIERLPNGGQTMSRSTQTLTRPTAAAFDFDVVTDVKPRPALKPQGVPKSSAAGAETKEAVPQDPLKAAG